MKFVAPSVFLLREQDPFKKIELAGRTCYKSNSAITEDSSIQFYDNLVSRKHFAMLEHAVFVFQIHSAPDFIREILLGSKYLNTTYEDDGIGHTRLLVSGNLRAINDSEMYSLVAKLHELNPRLSYSESFNSYPPIDSEISIVDISKVPDLTESEFLAHAHFTFHFTCDRGVTHEMVRHRPASYAQESTRYCNYSKDKFQNEVTYVIPANYHLFNAFQKGQLQASAKSSEEAYLRLLDSGFTPQQARAVLPNMLKTEIIMTANAQEYEHFFDLRSRGLTGAPHPDMKIVADLALELYEDEKSRFLSK